MHRRPSRWLSFSWRYKKRQQERWRVVQGWILHSSYRADLRKGERWLLLVGIDHCCALWRGWSKRFWLYQRRAVPTRIAKRAHLHDSWHRCELFAYFKSVVREFHGKPSHNIQSLDSPLRWEDVCSLLWPSTLPLLLNRWSLPTSLAKRLRCRCQ